MVVSRDADSLNHRGVDTTDHLSENAADSITWHAQNIRDPVDIQGQDRPLIVHARNPT